MNDVVAPSLSPTTIVAAAERVSAFLCAAYGWIFVGLGVTAVVAYSVAGSRQG
jgi:hypothetical protein